MNQGRCGFLSGFPGQIVASRMLAAIGEELTDAAIGAGGCAGASVVIYNPDLDPDGTGADRVARFGGSIARSAAR